ncbi:MAG: PorP/SprF family type IX secretion system membrane protein, partial [Bacteroidales bacterium]|nr:PorP/SprF family type IX secretion system membrane protein [Bacteroidales bacterium]
MRTVALLLFLITSGMLNAQPLARHNLYPFNSDFANPAATGMTGCLEIVATDMHQWVGISEAPNLQSLSVQKGIPFRRNKKNGVGINLIRDSNGPSKSLAGELLYSFHALVGRDRTTWLAFGMSGSVEQRRLDEGEFSPVFDPLVTGSMQQELFYNASAGANLYNDKYFAGFALYNLLPVNAKLGLGYGGDRYFMSFQGGYLFANKNNPLALQTSLQGFAGRTEWQVDLANTLYLSENLWTRLTFRKYQGAFSTSGQN